MEIIPEPIWETLSCEILEGGGPVMLIGRNDSGKSTLARYLTDYLKAHNRKPALIDADVGQSSIGVPGAIVMKIYVNSGRKMFFIGSVNPSKKIGRMIYGTKLLCGLAHKRGADPVVADTTGLVSGEAGRALKLGKIKALKPKHIIAIQRAYELEHILRLVEGPVVHRIPPSRYVKSRPPERRASYRAEKFREYFKEAGLLSIGSEKVGIFYNDMKLSGMGVARIEAGILLGLNRGEFTEALGIFQGIEDDTLLLKTPLKSFKGIDRILVGDIKAEEML